MCNPGRLPSISLIHPECNFFIHRELFYGHLRTFILLGMSFIYPCFTKLLTNPSLASCSFPARLTMFPYVLLVPGRSPSLFGRSRTSFCSRPCRTRATCPNPVTSRSAQIPRLCSFCLIQLPGFSVLDLHSHPRCHLIPGSSPPPHVSLRFHPRRRRRDLEPRLAFCMGPQLS